MPTVETNGIDTYYELCGSGPPVVFVHGSVMDHAQWAPQVEVLSEGYTTVVYDVRGHGRTGGSDLDRYPMDLYARDLHELVAALDLERPVVCGHSMGGCIAQVYAATYPDDLAGLVLADTFTPNLNTLRERLQMRVLGAAVLPVRLVGYERVQDVMVWFHERFNPGSGGEYATIRDVQANMPRISTDEFAKIMRSMTTFRELEIDYAAIAVPTLVLYGENEPSFIRRQAGILASEISTVTVVEVPDAGHGSNLDNPDAFADGLRTLLEAVGSSESSDVP